MASTNGSMAMETSTKNPKRVAAGRRNAALRRPWTDEARQRQRERCLVTKPWKASTGPRTHQGKSRVAANGIRHKPDPESVRQLQKQLAGQYGFLGMMQTMRRQLMAGMR